MLLTSCKNYKFLGQGTVTDDKYQHYGYQNHYYNDSLKLTLEIPGDFDIYKPKKHSGLKTQQLYRSDKKILRQLGIFKTDTTIKFLFSSKPIIEPFYHFVAFVNTKPSATKKSLYKTNKENDTILYYNRSMKFKGQEVYESIIPYHQKEMGFIYYSDTTANDHYFDIEDITKQNAQRIVKNDSFLPGTADNQCANEDQKPLQIQIPLKNVLKKGMGFITISKIDSNQIRSLIALKFLPAKVSTFSTSVCKGKYTIMYMSLDHRLLWSGLQNIN